MQVRVPWVASSLVRGIYVISLPLAQILRMGQQLVQEDVGPFLELLVGPTPNGQEVVEMNFPEHTKKISKENKWGPYIVVGQNYMVAYHCSITNGKLKVISSRKVVKSLHQT
jgi:hypothetical protein